MKMNTIYDAVIVGAGHNGLVAACYLSLAGRRVLVLEKNDHVGGATYSKTVFPGIDANLSVYAYLISLLPRQILKDLGLRLEIRRRATASYTPVQRDGRAGGLLISNISEDATRQSFITLTGDDREYRRYQQLESVVEIFAQKIWPTLLEPLLSKADLEKRFETPEERRAWEYLVEKPLSALIEDHLADDTVRGMVFTDAKIGLLTCPDDSTLLQNRTFIYHAIGQGTGEWRVPVGGMGALVEALKLKALSAGAAIQTSAEVLRVDHRLPSSMVYFLQEGKERAVEARYVLFNAASNVANRCLPGVISEPQVEGSVFKINMVLRQLPPLKDPSISAAEAFTGTLHLDEGYEQMVESYRKARGDGNAGVSQSETIPGEIYCHSLTDPSILGKELQERGFHTLTLFGLDVPYHWFVNDNTGTKESITQMYLRAINRAIQGDIRDYLAADALGKPCLEAKSPLDLEMELGLPEGNIFHGNLTWPFAEREDEAGTWGVETQFENVYLCGSSARRGGAVSGIPGRHAAMRVLARSG